jgi:hypothetical protein
LNGANVASGLANFFCVCTSIVYGIYTFSLNLSVFFFFFFVMFVTASVYLKVSVILIMIHHVRFFSRLNEQVSWVFIVHSSHLFVARGRAEREVTSIAAAGCWWRTFA